VHERKSTRTTVAVPARGAGAIVVAGASARLRASSPVPRAAG
jgi:hypothetical protein